MLLDKMHHRMRTASRSWSNLFTGIFFAIVILLLLMLAVLPIQNQAQIYMSLSLLAIMMLGLFTVKRLRLSSEIVDALRVLNIFIALYLIFRYLVWRAEFTIGGYGVISTIFGSLLFAAEVYAAIYAVLGFFVNFSPRTRQPIPLPQDISA